MPLLLALLACAYLGCGIWFYARIVLPEVREDIRDMTPPERALHFLRVAALWLPAVIARHIVDRRR